MHPRATTQRPRSLAAPVAAACVALLLLRPGLSTVSGAATPVTFAVLYAVLAVVALRIAREGHAARGRVSAWAAGAAGIVAVAVVQRFSGPAPAPSGGAVVAVLGVAAAVAEEAVFRRLLYDALAVRGALVAVIGSAALFALIHVPEYGIAALPVDLGAGLLLSWQRWASGRWEPCAATHAFANLLMWIR